MGWASRSNPTAQDVKRGLIPRRRKEESLKVALDRQTLAIDPFVVLAAAFGIEADKVARTRK